MPFKSIYICTVFQTCLLKQFLLLSLVIFGLFSRAEHATDNFDLASDDAISLPIERFDVAPNLSAEHLVLLAEETNETEEENDSKTGSSDLQSGELLFQSFLTPSYLSNPNFLVLPLQEVLWILYRNLRL